MLSLCDATTHDFLKQALHVSDAAATAQDETTELLNPTSVNLSEISFGIVSVEDWQAAFQHIAEGKQNGRSFPLIFLSVRRDQCDMVRENIEKIWELDGAVRCILCLPSDEASWPTNLSLSRT